MISNILEKQFQKMNREGEKTAFVQFFFSESQLVRFLFL